MNIYSQLLFALLIISCGNPQENINKLNTLEHEYKFCNSSLIFEEKNTNVVVINLDADTTTNNNIRNMADYFLCIKKELESNVFLKKEFTKRAKTVILSLISVKTSEVNFELINKADSSDFWTGDINNGSKATEFLYFITKSGYIKNWELTLSEIFDHNFKWNYAVENIFYKRGTELSDTTKKYTKGLYPVSFEIVLTRE